MRRKRTVEKRRRRDAALQSRAPVPARPRRGTRLESATLPYERGARRRPAMMVVILGAGPSGVSAAWRLQQQGHKYWLLLESCDRPGGLSMSVRDDEGFTWDLGGNVLFSHWKYFDRLLEQALGDQWVEHQREAWVWMRERWIPYPFQNNIWRLPQDDLVHCLTGLVDAHRGDATGSPKDFGDWLLRSFGKGLCETFMYPYNTKVWAYPPAQLGTG